MCQPASNRPTQLYLKVYGTWGACCFLTLVVIPVLLDLNHPGGEARGLTFIARAFEYVLYSGILLSSFFLSRYKNWTAEYLVFNGFVLFCLIYLIIG